MVPSSIRVLGLDVPVLARSCEQDCALDGRHAYFDPERNRIVWNTAECEESLKETLLHEILHALEKALATDLEEEQVGRFSRGLFAVMRDNPGLVAWWMSAGL